MSVGGRVVRMDRVGAWVGGRDVDGWLVVPGDGLCERRCEQASVSVPLANCFFSAGAAAYHWHLRQNYIWYWASGRCIGVTLFASDEH